MSPEVRENALVTLWSYTVHKQTNGGRCMPYLVRKGGPRMGCEAELACTVRARVAACT